MADEMETFEYLSLRNVTCAGGVLVKTKTKIKTGYMVIIGWFLGGHIHT
jgi:SNF family Na+-dependent transporter